MANTAVITGASSGIGRALAIQLAQAGYKVLAVGRNEMALQKIKAVSQNIQIMVSDISQDAELDKIMSVLNPNDKVSCLIHCAATIEPSAALTNISREQLQNSLDVNVMAPLFLTQKISSFLAFSSRVLFIGSDFVGVTGKSHPGVTGAYGISKSALKVAVTYLKKEISSSILIGYLNPGPTDTPMLTSFQAALHRNRLTQTQAASPEKVAEFMKSVLEESSDADFQNIDWDYRKHRFTQLRFIKSSL